MDYFKKLEYDHLYHIFHHGNNKDNLFIEDENYIYFLNKINYHLSPVIHLYAYCLLKNHFHLLVKMKSEKEIKQIVLIGVMKNKSPQKYLILQNNFQIYLMDIPKPSIKNMQEVAACSKKDTGELN